MAEQPGIADSLSSLGAQIAATIQWLAAFETHYQVDAAMRLDGTVGWFERGHAAILRFATMRMDSGNWT